MTLLVKTGFWMAVYTILGMMIFMLCGLWVMAAFYYWLIDHHYVEDR